MCRQFDAWLKGTGMLSPEIREYFGEILYFFVSDGCYRSVNQFIKQLKTYTPEEMRHVLVLNSGRLTQSGTFHYLQDYQPLMEAIKVNNIPVMFAPELATNLQFDADRHSFTYNQLLEKQVKIYERQQATSFLRKIDFFFNQIFETDINQPSGLSALVESQTPSRKKYQLPHPTKAELINR